MAKEITTTTVEKPDPPKPIKISMSVNERIQVSRFIARFIIAMSALGIFAYVVHVMLGSADELPVSSKDLLNILIGAFIPIIAGIAKFYFESGGDLHQEAEKNVIPPHPEKDDSETTI
tara:strand:+ start:728 stop:1081 length:354 start_codon:yes stop_codon:yes gene_type:complete